ncbi:MAG: hypothetical protein AAFY72_13920 [Cyanobacteria bacterium J06649_4]
MTTCPCCNAALLRHVRHNDLYWYCPSCRQEMPDTHDTTDNVTINNDSKDDAKSSVLNKVKLLVN